MALTPRERCLKLETLSVASGLELTEQHWRMIKFFFSTPFHYFPTIPILSLPGGPGDVSIVSDQNSVGWYIGLHRLVDRRAHELQQLFNNASCVYVQARRNG